MLTQQLPVACFKNQGFEFEQISKGCTHTYSLLLMSKL